MGAAACSAADEDDSLALEAVGRGAGGGGFASLQDAFKSCDPEGRGYIKDRARFATVARSIAGVSGSAENLWAQLDQDGNGAVSFPEFVEWAETMRVRLPVTSEGVVSAMVLPPTWQGPKHDPGYHRMLPVTDRECLADLQMLFDVSYRKAWTRDRAKTGSDKVPSGYELVRAERSENFGDWRRFFLRREAIEQSCSSGGYMERFVPPSGSHEQLCRRHDLHGEACNEWLLFHGTDPATAKRICSGDFALHGAGLATGTDPVTAKRICSGDFALHGAGLATGTLYGKGLYFADSITKADEYTGPVTSGTCAVLVCRVIGGQVLYNTDVDPNAQELERAVLKDNNFHSILGDREKCRGTFKEYVVFDADQVYVEYLLHYRRKYSD